MRLTPSQIFGEVLTSPRPYMVTIYYKYYIEIIKTIVNSFFGENYYLNKLRVPIVAHRLPTNFYLNFLTMFRQQTFRS